MKKPGTNGFTRESSLHLLTKYSKNAASSRYRSLQYIPSLETAGFSVKVNPLFNEDYLEKKNKYSEVNFIEVLPHIVRRVCSVLKTPRGSVVFIEKELLPWFPAILERWLVWRGCLVVVDYDDALFHQYDTHPNPWVRRLLGRKIATVMRLAHTVVAGNGYLADYARRAGAPRVEVIPTVIDLARYRLTSSTPETSHVFTIGWIGSPSTARYLRDIAPALAQVCRGGRARVRLVGSGPVDLPGVPVELVAWSEETEVNEIRSFDVGIMPLPDEPWTRGKCGFKLIQYMACSLPVVASPVGVNGEIVEDETNGFLAQDQNAWIRALSRLQDDADVRKRFGAAGRRKVEQLYCLDATTPRFLSILKSLSETGVAH